MLIGVGWDRVVLVYGIIGTMVMVIISYDYDYDYDLSIVTTVLMTYSVLFGRG